MPLKTHCTMPTSSYPSVWYSFRARVFHIGVHAEGRAAVLFCVILIVCDESAAISLSAFQWVNHKAVQHHDLAVFRGVLPCCVFVLVHLRLVDDGGGNYISVIQHDEQIASLQSGFCRFPGGVDAANPADGGKPLFLAVMNAVVDFFDAVNVSFLCFPYIHQG